MSGIHSNQQSENQIVVARPSRVKEGLFAANGSPGRYGVLCVVYKDLAARTGGCNWESHKCRFFLVYLPLCEKANTITLFKKCWLTV